MAEMPAAFVPIRLATTVFPDDPASTMPLPRLPDITFATTPEASEPFRPMKFRAEAGRDVHAVAAVAGRCPGQVQADVVLVEGDQNRRPGSRHYRWRRPRLLPATANRPSQRQRAGLGTRHSRGPRPGGPPLTCVGAEVASIVTSRAIAGSGPARAMVPFIPKLMRVEFPAGAALAKSMAARRPAVPVSLRLVTTIACEYGESSAVEAWAMADTAGKETVAETPATRPSGTRDSRHETPSPDNPHTYESILYGATKYH